jgi:hypothetical protein
LAGRRKDASVMNGFKEHGLREDDFAPKTGSIVSSFDAFRK